MNSFSCYCQGESHKSTNKPCQDRAFNKDTETFSIIVVCDGHGGEPYFRSQYGAEKAVEITDKLVEQFVKETPDFAKGAPFTSYILNGNNKSSQEGSEIHQSLVWLFSSIINQWNQAIAEHARLNDLSEWELDNVKQEFIDKFRNDLKNPDATFEKTYGCTLMAYVQTVNYWFAFHIGDGKCVRMYLTEDKELVVDQPVPWDEKCFLNKTTSLCDAEALKEFRYCFEGDGKFPLAFFLASDGIDDTFHDGDHLINFYVELCKKIASTSKEDAIAALNKELPIYSQKGSKDDMSVACVYDEQTLKKSIANLLNFQRLKLEGRKQELVARINQKNDIVDSFLRDVGEERFNAFQNAKSELDSQKSELKEITIKIETEINRNKVIIDSFIKDVENKRLIEFQYAKSDLEKAQIELEKINSRIKGFEEELEKVSPFYKENTNSENSQESNCDAYVGECSCRESLREDINGVNGGIKYPNGVYEGDLDGTLRNGHGKMIYSNGDIYVGEWSKDVREGKGKMIYSNGDIYEGEWSKDVREGKGKMVYSNGKCEECIWHSDKKKKKRFLIF